MVTQSGDIRDSIDNTKFLEFLSVLQDGMVSGCEFGRGDGLLVKNPDTKYELAKVLPVNFW
jgi:hypothetical protein